MFIWNLTSYIAIGLFALSFVILLVLRFRKNKYMFVHTDDEVFRETQDIDMKNTIYATSGVTRRYIKRYVIRSNRYDKSVICNYNESYKNISFYVVTYTKNQRVKQILKVRDTNTSSSSKIVAISKRTHDVNIIVASVDGLEINSRVVRPITRLNGFLFSLFSSTALLGFLYAIRHYIILVIAGSYSINYFGGMFDLIALGIIALTVILNFIVSYFSLRRRNFKTRNGGALEYEFF